MHRHFDRDIEELKDLLLRMGAMVEDTIARSIRAMSERDTDLAEAVSVPTTLVVDGPVPVALLYPEVARVALTRLVAG